MFQMRNCHYYMICYLDLHVHLGCHSYNISAVVFFRLLQAYVIVFVKYFGILKRILYPFHMSRVFSFYLPCFWGDNSYQLIHTILIQFCVAFQHYLSHGLNLLTDFDSERNSTKKEFRHMNQGARRHPPRVCKH